MTEELTQDQIVEWALNYASKEELEQTAKALYAIYAQSRTPDEKRHNVKVKKIVHRKYK